MERFGSFRATNSSGPGRVFFSSSSSLCICVVCSLLHQADDLVVMRFPIICTPAVCKMDYSGKRVLGALADETFRHRNKYHTDITEARPAFVQQQNRKRPEIGAFFWGQQIIFFRQTKGNSLRVQFDCFGLWHDTHDTFHDHFSVCVIRAGFVM